MSLVSLIIVIIVLVVVFALIQRYIAPALPSPWGTVVVVVYIVLVCLWLLSLIGVLPGLGNFGDIKVLLQNSLMTSFV